jgi:hypothetical protein
MLRCNKGCASDAFQFVLHGWYVNVRAGLYAQSVGNCAGKRRAGLPHAARRSY